MGGGLAVPLSTRYLVHTLTSELGSTYRVRAMRIQLRGIGSHAELYSYYYRATTE